MPADPVGLPQLPLFASHSPAYQDALAHYEAIRPILTRERTLPQQSRKTGLNYWRLWRHLRRFRREGLSGLIDQRKLPHHGAKPRSKRSCRVTSSSTSCCWPSRTP